MGTSSDIEIAGFDIEAEIGRGGFGVVYRARQLDLGRLAAIKVLLPGAGQDELQRRFTQECRAVGSLRPHPNVVTVYSTGTTTDGSSYLAMQYLAGGSLAERTPLPAGAVAALGARLADGLGVAHAGGVIHRDVKPANILFDADDEPVLVDFGISTMVGDGTTTSGDVALSVAYSAPEILRGERAGVPADVYALGATLFAAVAGRAPYTNQGGGTPLATLTHRILLDPVEDLRPLGVPDALCAVIERCMAKDQTRRFASMAELREALLPIEGDAVLSTPAQLWGMPTTTVGAPPLLPGEFDDDRTSVRAAISPRPRGGRARRRALVAAVAAAVALGAGVAAASVLGGSDDATGPVAAGSSTATTDPATSGPSASSSAAAASSSRARASRTASRAAARRSGSSAARVDGVPPSASRSGSSSSSRSVTAARNHPPVLGSLPVVRTDERKAVSVSFTAADADGDPLRYRVSGLPAGLTMSSSGQVGGRIAPTAADATTSFHSIATQRFAITVTVVDSEGAAATRRTTWAVRDTTTRMPNYRLRRGCDGQGSCQEPVPNIRTLGPHSTVCRVSKQPAGTILHQSVAAGTPIDYGTAVRYAVAKKTC